MTKKSKFARLQRIRMTNNRTLIQLPFIIFLLLLTQACAPALSPEASLIQKARWTTERIAPGAVWKYHQFDTLFDARQSITVLDINLDLMKAGVVYVDSGFFKTSTRAEEAGAIAAINGSFFNVKKGGSVVFLQNNGIVVTPSEDSVRSYRDNAGFAIDKSGNVSVIARPGNGWGGILKNFSTVLSSGPLLMAHGQRIPQAQQKFNTNRHPRTAVGLTKKHHLIAMVVDGRSAEAYGMTTEELSIVMKGLGCTDAMNLDGGGSSTAWVKGEGVVNYPSDNKKFDHEGERAVSNCILFLAKR
jgi:exopolysaccharide biosynthesis protein